ncbi:Flowering time control protein FCA [Glycine max]|nr:Flowering time control protein FCA [Glycine max]
MENNPKELPEQQRVNFNGDPHIHDNGNSFNHFQPTPAVDSGYALNHSMAHQVDVSCKVYVAPVPRTATEDEIRPVFEEHGTIVEIVLLKHKKTGTRQGSCFVKYATFDEADRAIKVLNNKYTFAGESYPVVVKFADRELERLGVRGLCQVADKVFVSSINKEATNKDIEEGCDHPLIVRFADPKKPKTGESRPLPNFGDSNTGGIILPHAPYHSTIAHPQVTSHMQNWEPGATVLQHPFPPHQVHPQVASMSLGSIQAPKLSSQLFITEVQRESHPADSSVQNIEQQLSSQLPSQTESNPSTVTGITPPDMPTSSQDEDFPECDWSEHYCPDGDKYYYNCVTCESRWDKPEEYALYEKESQKQQEQEDNSCSLSQLSLSSSQLVGKKQQETDHDHKQSETSPVVG